MKVTNLSALLKAVAFGLAIALGLALCPSLTGRAVAQDGGGGTLTPILVEAFIDKEELPGGFIYRKARNGVMGGMDIMDIPFTQFSYTEKTVEDFGDPSLPLNLILVNNPSIRTSNTSPMYTDFSIRGVNANGNNVYFNNVPNLFAQFLTPPNHIIGNIDVMSGPNTVLNGSTTSVNGTNGYTAPNGVISITSKRATADPITKYTQTFSGKSSFGEYIDFGRRFGESGAWGLRLNAQYLDGKLAVSSMGKKERNIFLNLDHLGDHSMTNLFGGYFDIFVTGGQRWFNVENVSTMLLDAPKSSRSFDYDGMVKVQRGYMTTLNHDQMITDNVTVFLNAGMTDRSGYKYDDNGGSLSLIGNTGVITDRSLNMIEANRNEYFQLGVKARVALGELINNISLAWDWSWTKNYKTSATGPMGSVRGSIFDGVGLTRPLPASGPALLINDELTKSVTLADQMEYGIFGLILAVQMRDNHFRAYNAARAVTEESNHTETSPSFAVTLKPIEDLLFYLSYSEGYTRARTVTNTSYANYGELIKPLKNKQYEAGAKYKFKNLIATLSLFNVDQGSFRDERIGSETYYRADGKNDYRGLEFNVNGEITPSWSVMGGLLYLDAKRKNTTNGTYDGMYVQGVAKLSGVLATEYSITENNIAMGRVVFSGPAYVTDANKVELPSWSSFDIGFKHKTSIKDTPITLSATCFNVLGKDHWIGRGGSNVIGLSMPRSFIVSAQIEF
jgi:iron complex outermembrane receptor protein